MTLLPDREVKNPFRNAKVVGANVLYSSYSKQDARRGDREFAMSRGEFIQFMTCPERWLAGVESDESKSTKFGTLMDALLLMNDDQQDALLAVCPATYPCEPSKRDPRTEKPWTGQANYCKEWEDAAEKDGRIVVRSKEMAEAETAVSAIRSDSPAAKRAMDFINASAKQVMVVAEYYDDAEELSVPVRTLIDLVPKLGTQFEKSLGDYKTAASASLGAWSKAVFEHSYHFQAAWNLDLYVAATGEDRLDFRHVIQENYRPWQVATRILSSEFIQLGRHTYLSALKRYCECLAVNTWPGYDEYAPRSFEGWPFSEPNQWMIDQSFA